jgi:hypothetical protein
MVVPIGAVNAVFSAIASLGCGVLHATVYAEAAIVTKVDAILVQASLALLAKHTAFLAVIVSEGALLVGSIAVPTLDAVHVFRFRAFLAEAAAIAKAAHAVCAAPTYAAKIILGDVVAFVAVQTVPTVACVAILAHAALAATLQISVAGTALVTVGE